MVPRPTMPASSAVELNLLRRAIDLSREKMLAGAGGPFGALVARGDDIVAEGWNRVTTEIDPTAHAEIVALRGAATRLGDFSLAGCVLFTSCEPCPMCLAAAYWARVDRIVFAATRADAAAGGFDDAFLYGEIALPAEQRRLPMRQALHAEAAAVFADWLAKPDRVPY
jgi:guanine deaminase